MSAATTWLVFKWELLLLQCTWWFLFVFSAGVKSSKHPREGSINPLNPPLWRHGSTPELFFTLLRGFELATHLKPRTIARCFPTRPRSIRSVPDDAIASNVTVILLITVWLSTAIIAMTNIACVDLLAYLHSVWCRCKSEATLVNTVDTAGNGSKAVARNLATLV